VGITGLCAAALAAACLLPWVSPPVALLAGIATGLLGWWPQAWQKQRKSISTYLIQGAIVLLGVWLSVQQLVRAGAAGLALSTGGCDLYMRAGDGADKDAAV
jgi:uncharacterized membrane protein YadS